MFCNNCTSKFSFVYPPTIDCIGMQFLLPLPPLIVLLSGGWVGGWVVGRVGGAANQSVRLSLNTSAYLRTNPLQLRVCYPCPNVQIITNMSRQMTTHLHRTHRTHRRTQNGCWILLASCCYLYSVAPAVVVLGCCWVVILVARAL